MSSRFDLRRSTSSTRVAVDEWTERRRSFRTANRRTADESSSFFSTSPGIRQAYFVIPQHRLYQRDQNASRPIRGTIRLAECDFTRNWARDARTRERLLQDTCRRDRTPPSVVARVPSVSPTAGRSRRRRWQHEGPEPPSSSSRRRLRPLLR